MSGQYAGIDLGGTRVKACLVTPSGRVVRRGERDTDDEGHGWIAAVRELLEEMAAGDGPIDGVGVAAPGLAAADGRSIASMPGRLAGLEGLDWTEALGGATPVSVLNDAHAFVLGEAWLGAARGFGDVVGLTLGTGVGGGVLVGGELLTGAVGRAGHLGHLTLDPEGPRDITGTPGSLEDAIGEHNLAARTGGRFTRTVDLVEAVRAGDADARAAWRRSVRALAAGISSLINAFDPECVVLGGGISQAGDELLNPLDERLAEIEWRPLGEATPIRLAEIGPWAGAIGAARRRMGHTLSVSEINSLEKEAT